MMATSCLGSKKQNKLISKKKSTGELTTKRRCAHFRKRRRQAFVICRGQTRSLKADIDPLVVDPPEGALSFLFDEDDENEGQFAGLAPDDLHKDNTSGGDPYGVRLPDPSADFMFMYERHNLFFVPYLRLAILDWGGFPGLEGRDIQCEPLDILREGLEPF